MKDKRNHHHLIPRSRNGNSHESNLLWIYMERHVVWHTLFKNLTIDEVIALLVRVKRAKDNQKRIYKL